MPADKYYLRTRADKRREQGLCITCGKNPPAEGKQSCQGCLDDMKARCSNYRKVAKVQRVCTRCFRNKAEENSSHCQDCNNAINMQRLELKHRVIEAYGGICSCCGESNYAFLTIDHIRNNGGEHRRSGAGRGKEMYKWLEDHGYPKDNYQLLCYNCNMGKHFNGGVCPHQVEAKLIWLAAL